ncbi:MAG: hypothetical protein AAF824_15785 [Bacteroidota bacterium]
MPAKAKYLSSGWVRFSKVMAAIFGAYAATMTAHLAASMMLEDDTPILLTSTFSGFLMWVGLMVMVFFIRRAWISWAILLSITLVSSLIIFL